MNKETSIMFLHASNEQSEIAISLNYIHDSIKIHKILKDKSDKRCAKLIH